MVGDVGSLEGYRREAYIVPTPKSRNDGVGGVGQHVELVADETTFKICDVEEISSVAEVHGLVYRNLYGVDV